ncbi:hypothetical protein [Paenibacillus sp. MMO-177]|uniref:hypothetical protein n=1 Tax=Paenibacillus sp. MMO-177 TaxID=3081289 RepID=UPI00301A0A32
MDKIKRDLRKYEVESFKDVPYEPWLLLGFVTPNSETSIAFSPSFEVPKLLWESDTEVLQMELTPLLLLNIVERIIKIFTRPYKITENTDPLFTDLFLQARYQLENEYPFTDRTKMFFHNFRESKKWKAAFAAFVRNNDDNEKTGVPSG